MRIALLGGPGSGKTNLSLALTKSLVEQNADRHVAIVDGYIDRLIEETGYAFGIHASYAQNLQVLFQRWTDEQRAEASTLKNDDDILISCGSLYESILYTAFRINNEVYVQRKSPTDLMQGRIIMECLGVIEGLIADHDLLFFLPYDADTLEEKGRTYDVAVNRKLPEVVAGYFKTLIPLTGNLKEKVHDALKAIDHYSAWQATVASVDEQSTV